MAIYKRLILNLSAAMLVIMCAAPARSQDNAAPDIVVTLLGTGSPIPEPGRMAPSTAKDRMNATTLVRAGTEVLLFDAGRGVVERLSQAGVEGREITGLFLTHFHSDHIVGLPDLWLTSRLRLAWGRRTTPFDVYGPVGVEQLTSNLTKAYGADIAMRPDKAVYLVAHEFKPDGVVFERNGVKVTMFKVDHGEAKEAVGYRVDFKGRSVLLSGDTKYDENIIKYGKGVDLMVHEVVAVKPALLEKVPQLKFIFEHHASPQQCGEVFTKTKPKIAVYSHIVLIGAPSFPAPVPAPSVEELIAQTRETYQGPLVSGYDLMSFEIGDKVTVKNPPGL
jgi:ribonuclease Z